MGVDDGVPGEHLRAEDLHETGRHDEARGEGVEAHGERGIPGRTVAMRSDALDERRDRGALGATQPLDVVAVGPDRRDVHPVGGVAARVEQGLQEGARSGHEDDDGGGLHAGQPTVRLVTAR